MIHFNQGNTNGQLGPRRVCGPLPRTKRLGRLCLEMRIQVDSGQGGFGGRGAGSSPVWPRRSATLFGKSAAMPTRWTGITRPWRYPDPPSACGYLGQFAEKIPGLGGAPVPAVPAACKTETPK